MKPLITIADDEVFIRQAYKEGLEEEGFEVSIAQDGSELLEMLKTQTPAVILLDLVMPKVDGLSVIKSLNADNLLPGIKVIVLSNLSQASDENEILAMGVYDFLIKADYSLEQIIDKVKQAVSVDTVPTDLK